MSISQHSEITSADILSTLNGKADSSTVSSHTSNTNNPHNVTKSQIGLGNVTNESKTTMFTNANLTGTPKATTAAKGTNNTQIATTEFVQTAISSANTRAKYIASDLYSFDGNIWNSRGKMSGSSVVYNGEFLLQATILDNKTINFRKSVDGIRWQAFSSYTITTILSTDEDVYTLYGFAYGNGKFICIYVDKWKDDDGDTAYETYVISSSDGVTWTDVTPSFMKSAYHFYSPEVSLSYVHDRFFMYFSDGEVRTHDTFYSTDGTTWTIINIISLPIPFKPIICYSDALSKFYTIRITNTTSTPSTCETYTSSNGSTWNLAYTTTLSDTKGYNGLIYGNNKLVFLNSNISGNTYISFYSTNGGSSWVASSPCDIVTTASYGGPLLYCNGMFRAGSFQSEDAAMWYYVAGPTSILLAI